MKTFKLSELTPAGRHQLLASAVAPRPIAFAGTIDELDNVNLSPFSFFNVFSTNPPVVIFSPSRRGHDGTLKHTHQNVLKVPEVTISMVDYKMVEQMSLASNEYPADINEFVKSGLTMKASQQVRPPYVAESPVAMECQVTEVIELGVGPGSGNLIICQVDLMHINEGAINEQNQLESTRLDLVGRMGGNWYVRASEAALFEVQKPSRDLAIGFDNLPQHLLTSDILVANELASLASLSQATISKDYDEGIKELISDIGKNQPVRREQLSTLIHQRIKKLLASGNAYGAFQLAHWYQQKIQE